MAAKLDVFLYSSSRLRRLTVGCIIVAIASVAILGSTIWMRRFAFAMISNKLETTVEPAQDPFDSSHYLRGLPKDTFRDNLLPDVQYMTSWISAGWTNDVMTYMNLIYLGMLTNRVPILPMFTPSHIGGSVPAIDFGEVFDVPRLRTSMNKPLVEWHEVKDRNSQVVEDLGCWNTWEAVQERERFPRMSSVPDRLKLDISYTTAPSWIKLIPNFEHDMFADFSSLAVLAFPEGHKEFATEPRESPQRHTKLPPDEHMLCYDYLYYVCAHQSYEFDFDYSPAWLFVGQFMHWNPRLEALAKEYVRKAFGTEPNAKTPPWIAIHVRHGDFVNWCGQVAIANCFASISVIARRVEEVKEEILERKGVHVKYVIMTSDERNATWWDAVTQKGWYRVDSSDTIQSHGAWYPLLIDAVVQSGGLGFVGTDRSTMSVLARRRVQSWRDGIVRTVKWGKEDSDNR